jgi:hypothetical protein
MPAIRLNYMDLPPEQRQRGASVARARLKAALTNPDLTKGQIDQLQTQMKKLDAWENGSLESFKPGQAEIQSQQFLAHFEKLKESKK